MKPKNTVGQISHYDLSSDGMQSRAHPIYAQATGMTMRDYFAGQALAGQIAYMGMEGCDSEWIAGCCYELADAMIQERDQ